MKANPELFLTIINETKDLIITHINKQWHYPMAILGRITGDINVFLADDEIFLRNACRESFSDYAIIINDKKNCDEYYLNMTFESKAGVWEAQFPLITDNNFSTLGVGRVRKTNRNKPVFKDLVDRRWVQ